MSAQGLIMLHIQTNNNLDIGTAPSTANLRMTLSQRGWLKRQNLSLDGPCETWQGQETLYNKETCRVLHFGWNNPTVSPAKKDLHITTGVRLRKLRRCSLIGSNANHVLGWTTRAMAGQSCRQVTQRGFESPPLAPKPWLMQSSNVTVLLWAESWDLMTSKGPVQPVFLSNTTILLLVSHKLKNIFAKTLQWCWMFS